MTIINDIKNKYRNGKLSRRQFMEGALAMGMTVAAASTFTADVLAATPKKGGRIRAGIAHGSTTDSLDPATYENGYMNNLNYAIHNQLGEVQSDGSITPELAESWDASNGAKTWVFNLRKGVEFHNGKTMTADDVVASVNYHRGEDSKSAAKPLLEQITDIKTDGPNAVRVDLSGGNADFPFIISDYHLPVKPSKEGKIDPLDPTGTGGYSLTDHEAGVRSLCTRNPNYFKSDRAHFDEFEMLSVVDTVARTSALKTGDVDTIDRCDLKTVHLLEKTPGVKVEETTGTKHYSFPMRTDTSPFDNNDVRMALKYAMDRESIVKTVLRGHGVVGNDHPIAPSNPYHNGEMPQRSYDPDKSRYHLKKAGMEGLTVDLSAADAAFPGAVDAAVLYKEQASKIGININVIREPNDGYWSNVWMNKPWGACYWGGRPTEDAMFSTAYAADADWNDTFWKNDRFNKLLIEGRAETDTAKRRAIYYEMQVILSNNGGSLIPMFANYVFATSDKVGHNALAGNWDMDGNKFMERWWFA